MRRLTYFITRICPLRAFTALSVASLLLILIFPACRHEKKESEHRSQLRRLEKTWHHLINSGLADSVISITRPFYFASLSRGDTLAYTLSALQISKAYTILENRDSALLYLKRASRSIDHISSTKARIIFYNVKGVLSLKYQLDYPAALSAFIKGYNETRKAANPNGMISMLANIAYLHYIMADPNGIRFARDARQIILSLPDPDTVSLVQAHMAMALMLNINNRNDSALLYLDKVDSLLAGKEVDQSASIAFLARGDILTARHDFRAAEKAYRNAIRFLHRAEPSIGVLTLLRFGHMKETAGSPLQADSLYIQALALSERFNNLEFRGDILLALAKLHARLNSDAKALTYYKRYHALADSLQKIRRVHDFNSLILDNHRLQRQAELQNYKIHNLRTQRIVTICVALLIILILVVISLIVLYQRKRKLYDAIVRRHLDNDHVIRKDLDMASAPDPSVDSRLALLYTRIEEAMHSSRIYRSKSLTLDQLAAAVASNRTYVSRAINACAGVPFNRYINNFRIAEAVQILSDPASDILIKELADAVGFSSDAAFAKIFRQDIGMSPRQYQKSVKSISEKS